MTTRTMGIFRLLMCLLLVHHNVQAHVDVTTPLKCGAHNNIQISCKDDYVEIIAFGVVTESALVRDFSVNAEASQKHFILRMGGQKTLGNYFPSNEMKAYKNLTTFELIQGHYTELKDGALSNLPTIKKIQMENGKLQVIRPKSFTHMNKLEEIHLEFNEIVYLESKVFIDLPSLSVLHLAHNNISGVMSSAFEELVALKELDLSNNMISYLGNDTFYGLNNLEYLNLTKNNVTRVLSKTFMGLTNLKTLDLASNTILSFEEDAFYGLSSLVKLNLSHNRIVRMPNIDLFGSALNINLLDLSHNKLETVYFESVKSIFQNFQNGTGVVNLQGNAFVCDCEVGWIWSLQRESANENAKMALANTTCFLEDQAVNGDAKLMNISTEKMTSKNETKDGDIMVDGKHGQMKQVSGLYLQELPCTKAETLGSSHSSSRHENARINASSSAKVQITVGIQILSFIVFVFFM